MASLDKCPNCGERSVVIRMTSERSGIVLRLTNVSPPPFCPMCGHPWWRDELSKEAYRITEDN